MQNGEMNNLNYIINKYTVDTGAAAPIFIPNTTRVELAKLFDELGFKIGAEVGVERGIFSEQLCQSNPDVKLFCIDAWKIYDECPEYDNQDRLNQYYDEVKTRLAPYNCKFIKKSSQDAVRDFSPESLDFVYIDANHSFDFVMSEIIEWSKIVKPGGIVSGHDYQVGNVSHTIKYGVIEAVNAYANAHQIKPWFVLNGDRSRSWFWVKG